MRAIADLKVEMEENKKIMEENNIRALASSEAKMEEKNRFAMDRLKMEMELTHLRLKVGVEELGFCQGVIKFKINEKSTIHTLWIVFY